MIGSLHLNDGEFFMDGFGALSPVASFKFGIDENDLQLGAGAGLLAKKLHDAQLWDVRVASSFAPLDPYLLIDDGGNHGAFRLRKPKRGREQRAARD